MKPQDNKKDNKLAFDKKTIAKLDQAQLGSLNGGAQQEVAGTTKITVTTIFIPGTEITVTTVTFD